MISTGNVIQYWAERGMVANQEEEACGRNSTNKVATVSVHALGGYSVCTEQSMQLWNSRCIMPLKT